MRARVRKRFECAGLGHGAAAAPDAKQARRLRDDPRSPGKGQSAGLTSAEAEPECLAVATALNLAAAALNSLMTRKRCFTSLLIASLACCSTASV
jgi:hypothetical protein